MSRLFADGDYDTFERGQENKRLAREAIRSRRSRLAVLSFASKFKLATRPVETPAQGVLVEFPKRDVPDSVIFERDWFGRVKARPTINTAMRRIMESD